MIDNRLWALLNQMARMPSLSIWKLSVVIGRSADEIKSTIAELNEALKKLNLPCIEIKDEVYVVPEKLIKECERLNFSSKNMQIYLQEIEREHLTYLYTFIRKEAISNYHYQDFLQVSKNTALNDIKKLRNRLENNGIMLNYTRANGYFLEGKEMDKRRMASDSIAFLLQLPIGSWALSYVVQSWGERMELSALETAVKQSAIKYGATLVEDRLTEIIYLVYFIYLRQKRVKILFTKQEKQVLMSSKIHSLSKDISNGFFQVYDQEDEECFLTMLLLGAAEGKVSSNKDEKLYQLTEAVINEMKKVAVIEFEDEKALMESLYAHLVPTYYRLLFGLKLQNTMVEQIKQEHGELFRLVKRALKPLEDMFDEHIPEEEIAYFTIHFGGQLEQKMVNKKTYRAVVICPNGISSSLILRADLGQLFPQIHWLEEHSIEGLQNLPEESYDMIFSTVYLKTEKKMYLVKPILTQKTKYHLAQSVSRDFSIPVLKSVDIEEIMSSIKKYTTIHDEEKLYNSLAKKILFQESSTLQEKEKLPMLQDLLTEDMIQFEGGEQLFWEDAIRLGCRPLEEKRYIEERYTATIIENVHKMGPFIDLGHGVAIPHARPENGVSRLGMSFLKLSTPVYLLEDKRHEIDTIICLAAIDNRTHLKALSQLTKILSNGEKLKTLKAVRTKEEMLEFLKKEQEAEISD